MSPTVRRLLVPASLLIAAVSAGAQDLATSFRSTEVAPGLHLLQGADGFGGGNIGLLTGPEKVVLIDDGMVPTVGPLLEAATEIAGRPVDFVINTHVHQDHVGGNAMLAENGALVFAHDNIRKRLVADPAPAGGEGGLPIVTFSDEVSFHVNGMEVRVFHAENAHTDGDGIVHFPDLNVIHAGDIMFHHMFPFIDLDNGGSVDGYLAAQRRLLELADGETILIPGHGELASRDDLQRDLDVLADSQARVRELVEQGMSEDEIVAANPLAEYHDGWNWVFISTERMTRTLVRDLASGE